MSNFTPKRAREKDVFTVDFGPLLLPNETISQAPWSIAPVDGADPAAATMILGTETIDGALVSQLIGGGVPGLMYAPICTAMTSEGRELVLPDDGFGLLYVSS
jgi:hypothetical protein